MRPNRIALHIALILLISLTTAGCAQIRNLFPSNANSVEDGLGTPEEQRLFLKGLDRLGEEQEKYPFKALREHFPQSPLNAYAAQLETLIEDQGGKKGTLESQLVSARQRIQDLEKQRNEQEAYIRALKDLIVRLELER